MPRDAIKRLRVKADSWFLSREEGLTLLDIAEAALLYMTDHSEATGEALIAALSKLEPGHAP